ncbi:MAG: PKD domain-containing protein, partial [Mycobacterium sp.]|nr:PKD domain-containing protein [Mycobacterium sp.]
TVPRSNLLAYNLSTGALISSFAPTLNGQVLSLAVTPDGSRLIAGGDFTSVNGASHNRIAEFDTATGALVSTFTANLNATVRGLAVTNQTVYAGGSFTTANGLSRTRLAAFQVSNGALTAWKATADYIVRALVLTPDGSVLVVGGAFQFLDGVDVKGIGAVSAATGSSVQWNASPTVTAYGTGAAFLSLATDGTNVYGSAYNFHGTGNLEGAFAADPDTGTIRWIEDCHGDTYGVFGVNNAVYTVSHAHYCKNLGGWPEFTPRIEKHTVAFTANATGTLLKDTEGYPSHTGLPCPSIVDWFPDFTTGTYTGINQAAWTVTGNSNYVVEGGEFPSVNNAPQQGLVRFAVPGIAPNKQAPRSTGAAFVPTLTALSGTSVRATFTANWDRDDMPLTYELVRNGDTTHPVATTTANSEWWNLPTLTLTDVGLQPLTTYSYRLYASDADGNTVAGNAVSVTTKSGTGNSPPTAAFSWSTTASLTASFDGSASSDPDGTITSYAWDFGDGETGAGPSPVHTYDAAGTYNVRLTVTDNAGATGTVTHSVAIGTTTVFAADAFARSVASGWGAADVGGTWSLNGSSSLFSVGNGRGAIRMVSPGAGPSAYLTAVSARDVDALVDVSTDKAPTGTGVFLSVIVRRSGTSDYSLQVKLASTSVTLKLVRVVSGAQTTLATQTVPGLTYTAGDVLRVRFDASGSGATTVSGKVWKASTAEPPGWHVTATDSAPTLQTAGGVGLMAYVAADATNAPVVASFDNLIVASPVA